MNKWTEDELNKIASSTELHLSTMRPDESLRNPVTIWVVRVGEDLYVRAVGGTKGKWYRHAIELHKGQIDAGGISKNVEFREITGADQTTIDHAYETKYKSYGSNIVGSTLTPNAHASTLMLIPR